MAQIPTYERRLSVNGPPGATVRNTWNEAAAGSGIAREIGRFGAALGARVDEWEDAEVLRSVNEFKRRVATYHNDPDKGILNVRKLGGAKGASDDAAEWMDAQMWEMRDKLGSARAQANFERMALGVREAQTLSNMKWEHGQLSAYRDAEAEGLIANTLDDLAAGYRDPEMLEHARERIFDAAAPKLEGLGPEAREKAVSDIEDRIAGTVAERLIEEDPLGAVAWLRDNKDRFSEGAYQKARAALKKAVKPYEQEAIRDQILARFPGNEGAARKYVMKNYSGTEETEIWRLVEAAYSDERRIKSQREADARAAVSNRIVQATGKEDAIAAVQRSSLSDKDKETMIKHIEQRFSMNGAVKARGFDPVAYVQMQEYINNMIKNYEDMTPDQADAIAIGVSTVFGGRVQDGDIKSAIRNILKVGAKSGEIAMMGRPEAVDPKLQRLQKTFGNNAMTNSDKYFAQVAQDVSKIMNDGAVDATQVNAWMYRYLDELDRAVAANGGRDISEDEKRKLTDKLFEEQIVDHVEQGWLWDTHRSETYYPIDVQDPYLPTAEEISADYDVPYWLDYSKLSVDTESGDLYYDDGKTTYTVPKKKR